MKSTIWLIIIGISNSIFFLLFFKSFSDFFTREAILMGNLIFAVFALGYLVKELYISYRERKIEPVQTYFDSNDEIINIDTIQTSQEIADVDIATEFKNKFKQQSLIKEGLNDIKIN